jgi:4-hydroxy-3-methylbut-2-en-1-yl diphosphate synthase IspG/GcpE
LQKKYTEPTPEAMVESAFRHIDILDKLSFDNYKISLKASEVFMTVFAYQQLALADATTSATLSARPILPGLIRKQSAPYSATLSAIL